MFNTECKKQFQNDPIIHTDYGNAIVRLSKRIPPILLI